MLPKLREVRFALFHKRGERFLRFRRIEPDPDLRHLLPQRAVHFGVIGLLHQPLARQQCAKWLFRELLRRLRGRGKQRIRSDNGIYQSQLVGTLGSERSAQHQQLRRALMSNERRQQYG